jgi:hypothetical protein
LEILQLADCLFLALEFQLELAQLALGVNLPLEVAIFTFALEPMLGAART